MYSLSELSKNDVASKFVLTEGSFQQVCCMAMESVCKMLWSLMGVKKPVGVLKIFHEYVHIKDILKIRDKQELSDIVRNMSRVANKGYYPDALEDYRALKNYILTESSSVAIAQRIAIFVHICANKTLEVLLKTETNIVAEIRKIQSLEYSQANYYTLLECHKEMYRFQIRCVLYNLRFMVKSRGDRYIDPYINLCSRNMTNKDDFILEFNPVKFSNSVQEMCERTTKEAGTNSFIDMAKEHVQKQILDGAKKEPDHPKVVPVPANKSTQILNHPTMAIDFLVLRAIIELYGRMASVCRNSSSDLATVVEHDHNLVDRVYVTGGCGTCGSSMCKSGKCGSSGGAACGTCGSSTCGTRASTACGTCGSSTCGSSTCGTKTSGSSGCSSCGSSTCGSSGCGSSTCGTKTTSSSGCGSSGCSSCSAKRGGTVPSEEAYEGLVGGHALSVLQIFAADVLSPA